MAEERTWIDIDVLPMYAETNWIYKQQRGFQEIRNYKETDDNNQEEMAEFFVIHSREKGLGECDIHKG